MRTPRFDEIRELELELLERTTRSDAARLRELLAEEFTEIGASGTTYDLAAVMSSLDKDDRTFELRDFDATDVADGIVLATYRLTSRDGREERRTLRSSLWIQRPDGWRLRFHQGTAVGRRG